jgi:TPR repeat protein
LNELEKEIIKFFKNTSLSLEEAKKLWVNHVDAVSENDKMAIFNIARSCNNIRIQVVLYQQLIKREYAPAMFELSLLYEFGWGVEKNIIKSISLLKQAAYRGYSPAQFLLGQRYLEGDGLKQNYGSARYWFNRAELYCLSEKI